MRIIIMCNYVVIIIIAVVDTIFSHKAYGEKVT